jgi:hypothetical protein
MEYFVFKIPFIGAVVNYIYDFCTYKKKWNLRLFFERHKIKNGIHYFSIRCVNKMSYNIKLTKIYIKESEEKAVLKIAYHEHKNGLYKPEYKNIKQEILSDECTNIYLSPVDTKEIRNYMMHDSDFKILNNQARIEVSLAGIKTELFIEYKIRDIKSSRLWNIIGFDDCRRIKVVIPI